VDGYTPARVSIDVDTPRPGFVFLADNFFPGWKAFLNGEKTDILRSWLTFRTVAVPAGRSRLEFRYEPLRLAAAIGMSLLACLGWLGSYLRHRWKRLDLMDPAPAAAQRPGKKKNKLVATLAADPAAARWTVAAVEAVILILVLPCLLYWGAWSVFIGHVSAAAKTGGLLLLLLSAAVVAAVLRPRRDLVDSPQAPVVES
jgi:membrane associated rhomboid family serine protease